MRIRTVLAASAALLIGATAVQAAEVAALSGDNTVSIVDTSKKAVTKTWKVEGVAHAFEMIPYKAIQQAFTLVAGNP